MGYYSVIKKNENAICNNRNGHGDFHTTFSMKAKQRKTSIIYHFYVESKNKKKKVKMNLLTKQKQTQRLKKINL